MATTTDSIGDRSLDVPRFGFGAGVADPGPLGLAGFASTTFFLSTVNAGLLPKSVTAVVLGLALFYGGVAQLLAGMWEFVKGNTFGALAFSSFGGFWLSYWFLVAHVVGGLKADAGDISNAIGVFLLIWTIFTAYMTVAATRVSLAVLAVFAALTLTFLFLTLGEFVDESFTKVGGWLGIITAIIAWYASFAAVTNATYKRVVLPVFPRV
ncbi:acetate uptake transporter [Paractinoplanes rhizophilus]|uniref:Acetate uptake transporter n=1 Tax=Paractinoplanes rhizophilus TaxID=1416877 RepID=A0ABW2HWS4_9ACTN